MNQRQLRKLVYYVLQRKIIIVEVMVHIMKDWLYRVL